MPYTLMGYSLVGGCWGLPDSRGGFPPTPTCAKPSMPSLSQYAQSPFTLQWSYWDPGKLNIVTLPHARTAASLSMVSSAWTEDRYCGHHVLLHPCPQPDEQGHTGPGCWLGALGTTATSSGVTGSAGDLGLGPVCGSADVPYPCPVSSVLLGCGCHTVCALLSMLCSLWHAVHHCTIPSVPCHATHAAICTMPSIPGYLCCATRVPHLCCAAQSMAVPSVLGHLHRGVHAVPCWLCHAVPCWLCRAIPALLAMSVLQEKVLELARPQLALVPLGYSMTLMLWDPHSPGPQLPCQSTIWQVRAQREVTGRADSSWLIPLTLVLRLWDETQPRVPRTQGSHLDQLVPR